MTGDNMKDIQTQRGFTLLYAVVVMGILMIVVFSVSFLTLRSLDFSFSNRNSQQAYYAAQSGGECALFWDISRPSFGRDGTYSDEIRCHEGPASEVEYDGLEDGMHQYSFQFDFPNTNQCAKVIVKKASSGFATVVESRGYNICNGGGDRQTERGFRIIYGQ